MSATSKTCHPSAALSKLATSMLLAAGAQAHAAGACDSLKSTLAERIEATGVRGYSLEAVPARRPVPPGAKAIGTCEGGAMKILYRRWGAARASAGDAGDAAPDAAPQPAVVAAPASATRPARKPVAAPERAAPAVAVAPVEAASAVAPRASEPEPVRTVAAQADAPPPPAMPDPPPAEAKVSLARQGAEFVTRHWPWFVAILLLPLVGWLWAWRVHRSAYDEAGLPRGPKL